MVLGVGKTSRNSANRNVCRRASEQEMGLDCKIATVSSASVTGQEAASW